MYAGKVIESGSVKDVLEKPLHPYTQGLMASAPSRNPRGQPLKQIPGSTPSLLNLPFGCAFQDRCSYANADCINDPVPTVIPGRTFRCYHPIEDVGAER
jgi:peptide/nickel transport system ATP-binding protein